MPTRREIRNASDRKRLRTDAAANPADTRKENTPTSHTARTTTTRKLNSPEAATPHAHTREAATRKPAALQAKTHDAHTRELETRNANARAGKHPTSRLPSVAVVGAGRLGSALALALGQSGYTIVALVARRSRRARIAARSLSPRPLVLDATRLDSLPEADLILITTPDDQITEVAARLAAVSVARRAATTTTRHTPTTRPHTPQPRRSERIALHASGALASDALAPLREEGFSLGSLHPLVSISDPRAGAHSLAGAFYCLEGEARALAAARKIVRSLGGQSFSIAARDKSLYHAAAVITSGHTVALFSLAADLLARCGLDDARARRVLLPLLASTLDNLKSHAPEEALTGTFARADLRTVHKHLAALREAGQTNRDALAVYALLGQRSLRLAARRQKFDPSVAWEIAALLRRVLDEV